VFDPAKSQASEQSSHLQARLPVRSCPSLSVTRIVFVGVTVLQRQIFIKSSRSCLQIASEPILAVEPKFVSSHPPFCRWKHQFYCNACAAYWAGSRTINLNDVSSGISMRCMRCHDCHHGDAQLCPVAYINAGRWRIGGGPALNHTSIKVQDSALFSRCYHF
jgi:hypothetical protein